MQFVRVFDAMTYSLLALGLVFCWPGQIVSVTGQVNLIYMLPLAALTVATFSLREDAAAGKGRAARVRRLKLAALHLFGLAPFLAWYVPVPRSLYLLLVVFLAVLSLFWYLFELISLVRDLLLARPQPRLQRQARLARQLMIYCGLIPVLSVYAAFFSGVLMKSVSLTALPWVWAGVPGLLKAVVLLPLLVTVQLLWQMRGHLAADDGREERAALRPDT